MENQNIHQLKVGSASLPLRPFQSKGGNECFALLTPKADGTRWNSPFGVPVATAAIGDHRKVKSVTVLGQTFPVTRSVECRKHNTAKKGKKAVYEDIPGTERPVLRASGTIRVGENEKQFSFFLAANSDEAYTVKAAIVGQRPAKGERPQGQKVLSVEDL